MRPLLALFAVFGSQMVAFAQAKNGPPIVVLENSIWSGSESLTPKSAKRFPKLDNILAFAKLEFHFGANNKVIMVDYRNRPFQGTYTLKGKSVRMAFFKGTTVYAGEITHVQNKKTKAVSIRLKGTGGDSSSKVRWTWSASKTKRIAYNGISVTSQVWSGSQTYPPKLAAKLGDKSGYVELRIDKNGKANLIDYRKKAFLGSYSRRGKAIEFRFFKGKLIYRGTIRLTGIGISKARIEGTVVDADAKSRWTFSVDLPTDAPFGF